MDMRHRFAEFRAIARKNNRHDVEPMFGSRLADERDPLAERAALKRAIDAKAEDGVILVRRAGHDCDGSHFCVYTTIRASVMHYEHFVQDDQKWCDGYTVYSIESPSYERY